MKFTFALAASAGFALAAESETESTWQGALGGYNPASVNYDVDLSYINDYGSYNVDVPHVGLERPYTPQTFRKAPVVEAAPHFAHYQRHPTPIYREAPAKPELVKRPPFPRKASPLRKPSPPSRPPRSVSPPQKFQGPQDFRKAVPQQRPLRKVAAPAPVRPEPKQRQASPSPTKATFAKSTLRGADRLKEVCNHPKTDNFDTPEYQAQSAYCKLQQVWSKVKENDQIERWFVGPEFQELFDQDMNLTYDSQTDTMPINRVKRTHPRGVTNKVQFIAAPDTPYTGLFKGSDFGVMRISETTMTTPEVPKTAPGYGLKLFRDGMASGNMLTMFAFDGQPSYNFFKNRWTTILREMSNECARETIGKKLAEVTDHIGATSVMEMAEYDQYGVKEEKPNWPFQIDAEPYDVYGWTDKYQNDFQDQISTIPANTVMFKLFGYDVAPEFGGQERLMGWIVSRSETTTSLWADQKLFFQHRRLDDDIKHRPHYFDWLEFWDNGKMAETPLANPAPQQKCPFFFLFEQAGLV